MFLGVAELRLSSENEQFWWWCLKIPPQTSAASGLRSNPKICFWNFEKILKNRFFICSLFFHFMMFKVSPEQFRVPKSSKIYFSIHVIDHRCLPYPPTPSSGNQNQPKCAKLKNHVFLIMIFDHRIWSPRAHLVAKWKQNDTILDDLDTLNNFRDTLDVI